MNKKYYKIIEKHVYTMEANSPKEAQKIFDGINKHDFYWYTVESKPKLIKSLKEF